MWQTFLTCFGLNAGDWKLVPGSFMGLLKWLCRCAIFNSWQVSFLIFLYLPFQKSEQQNLNVTGYWVIWAGYWTEKDLGLSQPQSSKFLKRILKIIVLAYIYQFVKFDDSVSCGSKDMFKNAPCLMYQSSSWPHIWIMGWLKIQKTWISWGQNTTFLKTF